jgi:predicted DNA-binding transcriptional regulator AlpA
MFTQLEDHLTETPVAVFPALLSDDDLAGILGMTINWIRSHAHDIPGFKRLGAYYRFCRQAVEQWLGSLDPLLDAKKVSELLSVPDSWVYANADEITGVLRLGHYVRFRPACIQQFLTGIEVVQ